jgi:hypothetical protein
LQFIFLKNDLFFFLNKSSRFISIIIWRTCIINYSYDNWIILSLSCQFIRLNTIFKICIILSHICIYSYIHFTTFWIFYSWKKDTSSTNWTCIRKFVFSVNSKFFLPGTIFRTKHFYISIQYSLESFISSNYSIAFDLFCFRFS